MNNVFLLVLFLFEFNTLSTALAEDASEETRCLHVEAVANNQVFILKGENSKDEVFWRIVKGNGKNSTVIKSGVGKVMEFEFDGEFGVSYQVQVIDSTMDEWSHHGCEFKIDAPGEDVSRGFAELISKICFSLKTEEAIIYESKRFDFFRRDIESRNELSRENIYSRTGLYNDGELWPVMEERSILANNANDANDQLDNYALFEDPDLPPLNQSSSWHGFDEEYQRGGESYLTVKITKIPGTAIERKIPFLCHESRTTTDSDDTRTKEAKIKIIENSDEDLYKNLLQNLDVVTSWEKLQKNYSFPLVFAYLSKLDEFYLSGEFGGVRMVYFLNEESTYNLHLEAYHTDKITGLTTSLLELPRGGISRNDLGNQIISDSSTQFNDCSEKNGNCRINGIKIDKEDILEKSELCLASYIDRNLILPDFGSTASICYLLKVRSKN